MLLEKLEQEGIKKELEALGYNCEEIFGGLKEETDRLYASYSWQKIPCTVEGIREYVIHAVPPKKLREKDYPWEEWFIQFDEPYTTYCLCTIRRSAMRKRRFRREIHSIRRRFAEEPGTITTIRTAIRILRERQSPDRALPFS